MAHSFRSILAAIAAEDAQRVCFTAQQAAEEEAEQEAYCRQMRGERALAKRKAKVTTTFSFVIDEVVEVRSGVDGNREIIIHGMDANGDPQVVVHPLDDDLYGSEYERAVMDLNRWDEIIVSGYEQTRPWHAADGSLHEVTEFQAMTLTF